MSDINSNWTIPDSPENQKKLENDFNSLLKRKSKKLAKDKLKEQWFYKNFSSNKYKKSDLKDELLEWLSESEKNTYTKFVESMKESEINELFEIFSNEIWLLSYHIEARKNELVEYYLDKYIISSENEKKLKQQIELLDEDEIKNLINSNEIKKEEIINKLFWKWKINLKPSEIKKEIRELLVWADLPDEMKNRILKKTNLAELNPLFSTIRWLNDIDISIVNDLFQYDILSPEDKRYFLIHYVPFVSLWDLKKSWIISENKAREKVKNDLINSWKSNDADYISENIDLDNYVINSKSIIEWLNSNDLDNFIKYIWFAQKFASSYNETLKEIKDWYLNSVQNIELFNEKVEKNQQIKRKIVNKDFKKSFVEWSILKLTAKSNDRSNEESFVYLEIVKFHDNWTFTFLNRTDSLSNYDSSINLEKKEWHYSTLYETFWKNEVNEIEVIEKNEIIKKINLWEINESENSLNLKSDEDFDEIKNKKINDLKDKLNEFSKWKTIDELENNSNVKYLIEELEELENINLDDFNYNYLLEKINLLDSEWKKFWLDNWVSFKITKSWIEQEWMVYTITSIDRQNRLIHIKNALWEDDEWTFEEFYKLFKDYDIKRFSNNEDYTKLPELLSKDDKIWKIWDNFEVKNDEIIKKDSETWISYDYLVANDDWWDELIKIHEVNWWKVKISFWKILDQEEVKKDDYWKNTKSEKKWEIFETEEQTYEVTIWFLEDYIKSKKLEPRSFDESKDKKNAKLPHWVENRRISLVSKIFANKSLIEVIQWMKVWVDSIQHYLKESHEEHANAIALAVYGKFLPIELQSDLRTRVEQWEKKHMDEYIWKLKAVDSPIATWMIEKWLLIKNTPRHKVEAWLLFMMESYWTLYAKKIYEYKWRFLWYEALGWHIWDDLYKEVESDAKKAWIQFSEEELVHQLLKRQCKPEWFHHIHRRSRIHKEFEWSWKAWMKKDKEKWLEDSKWKRTIDWRIKWWIDELYWWTYPNSMWWFEWVVWKWWPMHKMNKLPFIMLFSWIAYNFNQKMADEFKNSMNDWRNIPAARFISLTSDIDLFNQTVLELSSRFRDLYWSKNEKYNLMYDRAKKIFDNQNLSKKNEKNQIEATESFFDDYWEILTRSMYMLNTWKDDEYNLANKLIFLEKDSNPIFKKYYAKFRAYIDQDANFKVKDYMTDAFKFAWTSWYDLYKFTRDTLSYRTWGWFFQAEIWPDALKEVENEFLSIPKRTYSDDKKEDEQIKRKILKEDLREFIAWILTNHSWDERALESINKPWSHFSKIFDRYWIELTEFNKNNISDTKLLSWDEDVAERILDKYVSNAFNGTDHSKNRGVSWIINFTWWSIAEALSKPVLNDETFERVA